MKGLKHLSYEESLQELAPFSSEKRKLTWVLIIVYKYLNGACKENTAMLFSEALCAKTGSNRPELEHKRFQLNFRKNFFTIQVTEHWNRLPREISLLEFLQTLIGHDSLQQVVLLEQCGLDQITSRSPYRTQTFCYSVIY